MNKNLIVLALALALSLPSAAYAGSGGTGGGSNTTTYTTTTSTSTSTSASTSYSTTTQAVDEGTVFSNTTYNGFVNNIYGPNGDHPDVSYSAVVSGFVGAGSESTFNELVVANFGQPQNYMYWSANGEGAVEQGWGSLGDSPYSAYVDAASIATDGYISGRGSLVSSSTSLSSATSTTISLGSSSSVSSAASQQQTQQVTDAVTDTVTPIVVGDTVVGYNTNVNTNVNTNTNTNTNTNYNTNVSNYSGEGVTDVYQVSATVAISPIVLDLSGSGKLDASEANWLPHHGVKGKKLALFDFYANNQPVIMEWVGAKAGLLVEPKADGTVDGSCLFGVTGGYDNGYEKLSLRDKNGDGKLTGAELAGLSVWVDANGNGKVDKGELHSLQSLHITALDLHQKNFKSTFVMNGKSQTMWDWWPTAMIVRKIQVAKR